MDTHSPEAEAKSQSLVDSLVENFAKCQFDSNTNDENQKEKSKKGKKKKSATESKHYELVEKLQSTNISTAPITTNIKKDGTKVSILEQFLVLTVRGTKNLVRDRLSFLSRILESLLMGFLIGLIFLQMEDNPTGFTSRIAMFFIISTLQPYILVTASVLHCEFIFFGLIVFIILDSQELRIFDREYNDGMYNFISYWASTRICMLPLDILCSILFSIITYWMSGLVVDGIKFLWKEFEKFLF